MHQPVSIRDLWDGQVSPAVTEKAESFQELLRRRESLERSVTDVDAATDVAGGKDGS